MARLCSRLAAGQLVGDVIITRDEIEGLMADLLYVDAPPTGKNRSDRVDHLACRHPGRSYASELARRKDRSVGIPIELKRSYTLREKATDQTQIKRGKDTSALMLIPCSLCVSSVASLLFDILAGRRSRTRAVRFNETNGPSPKFTMPESLVANDVPSNM